MRTIKLKIFCFSSGVFEQSHQILRESYAYILKNVVAPIFMISIDCFLIVNKGTVKNIGF